MTDRLVYLIGLEVAPSARPSFEEGSRRILADSKAMGRDFQFDVYRDPMRPEVLQIIECHPDSTAAFEHFRIFGAAIRMVWETATVTHVEVLGNPAPQLREALLPFGATIKPFWFGTSGTSA